MPVDSQYYQAEQAQPERIGRKQIALRDTEEQWQKSGSGNPTGRPLGSRNRATLMAQALVDALFVISPSKAPHCGRSGFARAELVPSPYGEAELR